MPQLCPKMLLGHTQIGHTDFMSKVRLTDRYVASVSAPPGRRTDIFDDNPLGAGLILRVSQTGRKSWVVRYRNEDGEQRRFGLGLYPDVSLAEARKRCIQARLQASDGVDPAGAKRRKISERRSRAIKTFNDLSLAYFDATERGEWKPRGKRKRPSTISGEKWLWTKHIQPSLGALQLADVTPAEIKELLKEPDRQRPGHKRQPRASPDPADVQLRHP